jgi:hypothetical protein
MKKVLWSFVLLTLLSTIAAFIDSADAAPRRFYLTKTMHDGANALQACKIGFHMASLWEIYEISSLRYANNLGVNNSDSGFGPPTALLGWVRTGFSFGISGVPGSTNCLTWTSNHSGQEGTLIVLPNHWGEVEGPQIGLWLTTTDSCSATNRVWCVQD